MIRRIKIYFKRIKEPVQTHTNHAGKLITLYNLKSPYRSGCCDSEIISGCSGHSPWEKITFSCYECRLPVNWYGDTRYTFDEISEQKNNLMLNK